MLHRVTIVALACWLLAGCGFQPLYGKSGSNDVVREFSYIDVAPIKDRMGQQLRNELVQRLHTAGRAPFVKYRLVSKISQSKQSLAVQKSAFSTRANLTVRVEFDLVSTNSASVLLSIEEQATVSYNVLDSEFATLAAERDAQTRAIKFLSDDIRVHLAIFFDRQQGPVNHR